MKEKECDCGVSGSEYAASVSGFCFDFQSVELLLQRKPELTLFSGFKWMDKSRV